MGKFSKTFMLVIFSRQGLRDSLDAVGFKYLGSVDYPKDIPNPQKLYSSIFEFTGVGKSWLTPLVMTTQYRIVMVDS